MLTLVLALVCGLMASGLCSLAFSIISSVVCGVLIAIAVFFVLSRLIGQRLQAEMLSVQQSLGQGPQYITRAIGQMKDIRDKYAKWQFFAASSMDAQIGTILFMQKKYKEAEPYLEKAFSRIWQAKAMLGVLYWKRKEYQKMDDAFELAAKYSPKQGLLWGVWGYLHQKAGAQDKAIQVLSRGHKILAEKDPTLQSNLLALQNGKKMKMKTYGDAWYQFHLETHPQMKAAARGQMRFARR